MISIFDSFKDVWVSSFRCEWNFLSFLFHSCINMKKKNVSASRGIKNFKDPWSPLSFTNALTKLSTSSPILFRLLRKLEFSLISRRKKNVPRRGKCVMTHLREWRWVFSHNQNLNKNWQNHKNFTLIWQWHRTCHCDYNRIARRITRRITKRLARRIATNYKQNWKEAFLRKPNLKARKF